MSNLSVDIDECSSEEYPCDFNANCTNNVGSFSCTCQIGYTGNGLYCEGKNITYTILVRNFLMFIVLIY